MPARRLVYLSEARIPSRSSNSMQTMRMCAAFATAGAEVRLLHLVDDGEPPEGFRGDVEGFYGIPRSFERRPHPLITHERLNRAGRAARPARGLVLAAQVLRLAAPGRQRVVLYTRSHLAAWLAVQARRRAGRRSGLGSVAVEVHDRPPTESAWRALEEVDAIVVISQALKDLIAERLPHVAERVWVEHDGVDLASVPAEVEDPSRARARLGLPSDRPIVMYTGRVNAGKGVGVLLAAAERFVPSSGAHVVLVGKVYDEQLRRSAPEATFTGFVAPSEVPAYLAAADVLVMPTTEDLAYAAYTSPLKLFEYMAAGRPVVASGLATVREVLRDGENALLYPPDDAGALATAVARLLEDPGLATRLADQAARDVREYAWNRRAERILSRL